MHYLSELEGLNMELKITGEKTGFERNFQINKEYRTNGKNIRTEKS